MTYQRHGASKAQSIRESLWSRYKPIYDDTFADLLEKLDQIEFPAPKKS